MPTTDSQALEQEWTTLQNNIEQYEKTALLIKLVTVVLFTVALVMGLNMLLTAALVLILWLQEAIFRTSQSRLGQRIVRIEGLFKRGISVEGMAFQLHSEWLASRKDTSGLLLEYFNSALRPTVAFPYPVLLLIDLAICLQGG
ncbi:hypothetical protein [Undibacterium sp.]|jgi:hypothetical protein|uniref:hypothetical protein n=1 Tax=Undibacterium sp. TaxID=1914977 RepID=UPI002CE0CA41|nr:hypothetical protein [Undibacterium sp.]HTD05355.1 hypothetical protein [Undibacterium sp.]